MQKGDYIHGGSPRLASQRRRLGDRADGPGSPSDDAAGARSMPRATRAGMTLDTMRWLRSRDYAPPAYHHAIAASILSAPRYAGQGAMPPPPADQVAPLAAERQGHVR